MRLGGVTFKGNMWALRQHGALTASLGSPHQHASRYLAFKFRYLFGQKGTSDSPTLCKPVPFVENSSCLSVVVFQQCEQKLKCSTEQKCMHNAGNCENACIMQGTATRLAMSLLGFVYVCGFSKRVTTPPVFQATRHSFEVEWREL